MAFIVKPGGSTICHIDVMPAEPKGGEAQPWKMVDTSVNPGQEVNDLSVDFSLASTPAQCQVERMIFVFTIAEAAQTGTHSWRFVSDGLIYCKNKADDLGDVDLELSNNGQTLTATIKCLTDKAETVNFSFLGLQQELKSGICNLYASPDPGGTFGRR